MVVAEDHLEIEARPNADVSAILSEGDFAHLLFHGYDRVAAKRFDHREDADVLHTLFPAQDFIIWSADAF